MRLNLCLPAVALLLFLPVRADEAAPKAPPAGDTKPAAHSCCAGEESAGKALCPKGREKTTKKTDAKAKPAAAPAAAAPAAPGEASLPGSANMPGTANMVVTRDPETGELRNATAAERAQLFAGRAPQAARVPARVVVLPDGTEMMELGEESMHYAVATKAADGSVQHTCVHGKEAADEALTAPRPAAAPKPTAAPRAEER
jgi:hypothetical protein